MALNLEKQLLFVSVAMLDSESARSDADVEFSMVHIIMILLEKHVDSKSTTRAHLSLRQGTNSPTIPLPQWMAVPNLPANLGTIACLVYSTLYVLLEPVAGTMLAPLLLAGTAFANHLTATYGMKANYIAIGVHIFSWVAQFIGHGVFEGRAPALLDNLIQAIFLAPLFVWLEVLFAFGYRPELKARLDKSVEAEIDKFQAGKKGADMNGHAIGTHANGKAP